MPKKVKTRATGPKYAYSSNKTSTYVTTAKSLDAIAEELSDYGNRSRGTVVYELVPVKFKYVPAKIVIPTAKKTTKKA